MPKDRYTVGNICLVVFLAFIFSVITAIVKVEPAAAVPVPPISVVDTPTGTYTQAEGLKIHIPLSPVTPVEFGSLQYYITLKNEDGSTRLAQTKFTFSAASGSVTGSVYGRIVDLVYMPSASLDLATTFNAVYLSINQNIAPNAVYLELTYKPPTPPSDGGGGGGGGAPVTGGTVETTYGTATVEQNSTTVQVETAQALAQLQNLPPTQPVSLVSPDQTALIKPAMTYEIPQAFTQAAGERPVVLAATGVQVEMQLSQIPAGTTPTTEQSEIRVSIDQSELPSGAGIQLVTDDNTPLTPFYKVKIERVTGNVVEDISSTESDHEYAVTFEVDANVDPTRLRGVRVDEEGNVTTISNVVFNPGPPATVTLYTNRFSYYGVMMWKGNFKDIASHWAMNDILTMASRGVTNGFPDGTFAPEAKVTRAEFAALLVRSVDRPLTKPETPKFKDVPTWAWYYQPIETAASLGLVKGYGDGTFAPNARISRVEMATMIIRAMGLLRKEPALASGESAQLLSPFADAGTIPTWATESAAKAVKSGIVAGRTPTSFQPLGEATRAESVVMLKRLLDYRVIVTK